MPLLDEIIYGAYAFGAGAYAWAWALYSRLASKLNHLHDNHMAHMTDDIEALRRDVEALKARERPR